MRGGGAGVGASNCLNIPVVTVKRLAYLLLSRRLNSAGWRQTGTRRLERTCDRLRSVARAWQSKEGWGWGEDVSDRYGIKDSTDPKIPAADFPRRLRGRSCPPPPPPTHPLGPSNSPTPTPHPPTHQALVRRAWPQSKRTQHGRPDEANECVADSGLKLIQERRVGPGRKNS